MSAHGAGVTLQINVAPTDLPHLHAILPHQLRQWAGQVDEVLLTVDRHASLGLFAPSSADQLSGLRALIDDLSDRYANLHAVDVDYAPEVVAQVSADFFGGGDMPLKDWRAAPIYPYFYGLRAAAHDFVFHTDSDMLYGGGSQTWIDEARQLLTERSDVLVCSPLPGPPTADGRLRSQTLPREPMDSLAFRADSLSTRLFFIDRARLTAEIGGLKALVPAARQRWMARIDGNPLAETAEIMLSAAMAASGLVRIDFLGTASGMWSVHPPYRSALFYETLPEIIRRIEAGDVPDGQRGDHELNDTMVDWSTAKKPRWVRWSHHARRFGRNNLPLMRR